MILTFDVGNTTIAVCGVYEGNILFKEGFATSLHGLEEGYLPSLKQVLDKNISNPNDISGTIISSVVPDANIMLKNAALSLTGKEPHFVDPADDTGLMIKDYDESCLGIDRLIDCAAAAKYYGAPVCVYDLGTASTLSVVDKEGCFRGGAISAGVQLSLDTLDDRCARLPLFYAKDAKIEAVIGTDVKTCMEIGAVVGCAAMIDGMAARVSGELGCDRGELKVVLTGGNAPFVLPHIMYENVVYDPDLIHKGMEIVWRNSSC